MKIAEALLVRSKLMRKVASLKERIAKNATVQEGDKPDENPEELIEDIFSALKELESIICKINRANLRCLLSDGRTMMEGLACRDRMINQHAALTGAIESAQANFSSRYSRQEIKWVKMVDVPALQKQADGLSEEIVKLNAAIQETNWVTELEV